MTEQEWLERGDLLRMVRWLRGKASDRKLRLFACACCHRIGHLFADRGARIAVRVAEQFAEGEATPEQFEAGQERSPSSPACRLTMKVLLPGPLTRQPARQQKMPGARHGGPPLTLNLRCALLTWRRFRLERSC